MKRKKKAKPVCPKCQGNDVAIILDHLSIWKCNFCNELFYFSRSSSITPYLDIENAGKIILGPETGPIIGPAKLILQRRRTGLLRNTSNPGIFSIKDVNKTLIDLNGKNIKESTSSRFSERGIFKVEKRRAIVLLNPHSDHKLKVLTKKLSKGH